MVIDKIKTGGVKPGTSDYSICIDITVQSPIKNNWAFGFYMPRIFNRLINNDNPEASVNPDLTMTITELKTGKSEDLKYVFFQKI